VHTNNIGVKRRERGTGIPCDTLSPQLEIASSSIDERGIGGRVIGERCPRPEIPDRPIIPKDDIIFHKGIGPTRTDGEARPTIAIERVVIDLHVIGSTIAGLQTLTHVVIDEVIIKLQIIRITQDDSTIAAIVMDLIIEENRIIAAMQVVTVKKLESIATIIMDVTITDDGIFGTDIQPMVKPVSTIMVHMQIDIFQIAGLKTTTHPTIGHIIFYFTILKPNVL
jgi:predicted subunit of tRNA(5-methylaminomethyl-2-thiouridylate) methyltransferase